ncbi:asparagine synthase-related protein, partial [Clostridioides difficile]|uniref:asparagine synthase-related protein n=1 Tax=Clostridioides difficile TaxID=1496 RepID=UPI0011448C00
FHPDHSKAIEEWTDESHTTLQKSMPEVKSENETAELFLSGGVDSSYILAMSDIEKTGSCGYDEERFDESKLAQQTANILGCKNSRYIITPEEYFASVPYVMYHMEQPTGDASAIVFAIGCKAAAENTNICYSGEGADEFFGGYNIYHKA